MNNKELIKNAFENIAPSEELLKRVKTVPAAKMRSVSKLRKGIIIPAVICFAACLGVTAAALTGNLDFDVLFGDRIRVADSELAPELLGRVSNVKYSVSDDDYLVTVAGVTGGADTCYAVIEISRKDGTPVTEHFQNSDDLEPNDTMWLYESFDVKHYNASCAGGIGTSITDSGNIIFTMELSSDGTEPLSGKVISAEADTLVRTDRYLDIKKSANSYYGVNKGKRGFFDCGTNEPVQMDITPAITLPLNWSISFKYTASDRSKDELTCKAPEEKTVFRLKSDDEIGDKLFEGGSERYEFECTVKSVKVSPTGGMIELSFPCDNNDLLTYASAGRENDVYLVKTDGSRIPVSLGGWSGKVGDSMAEMNISLEYRQPNEMYKSFMDISEVCALSFNGTEYLLN